MTTINKMVIDSSTLLHLMDNDEKSIIASIPKMITRYEIVVTNITSDEAAEITEMIEAYIQAKHYDGNVSSEEITEVQLISEAENADKKNK